MKDIKNYILEAHKWDNNDDELIYDFIKLLFDKIEDECGNFGLKNTYLRADGYEGRHGDVITWGHRENSRSFVKKGIQWRDEYDYNIEVDFPEKVGKRYFDDIHVISFNDIIKDYKDLVKKISEVKEQKIDYKKVKDILYDLEDAVANTSNVYLRAIGYQGHHGNVINWLKYGVNEMIDDLKYWSDDYECQITIDIYGNKKMVEYLKKNCDFLEIDNSEVVIKISDIMDHFDELHDALS